MVLADVSHQGGDAGASLSSLVCIYTDGACSGNPGPGGWAALLRYQQNEREISGGETSTTNNRMELLAVIKALALLKRPCQVEIYSDSRYVIDGFTCYLPDWQRRGWKLANKQPVRNQDLWLTLLDVAKPHKITFHWVKGHDGHPENSRVDELAREQAQKFKSSV